MWAGVSEKCWGRQSRGPTSRRFPHRKPSRFSSFSSEKDLLVTKAGERNNSHHEIHPESVLGRKTLPEPLPGEGKAFLPSLWPPPDFLLPDSKDQVTLQSKGVRVSRKQARNVAARGQEGGDRKRKTAGLWEKDL